MATLTTLDGITKTFYMNEKVLNLVHAKSILFDKTAKKSQLDVSGKNYTYAVRTSRNRYAGRGIAEGGDYGAIGSQGTGTVVVPNAEIVTGIELSSRVVNAATGANKGAFASAFQIESEWGMKDTMQSLNRQLHSDGTDALAFWTSADDTSGEDVDDGQGNAFPIFLETGATVCDLIDASDNSTVLGDGIVVTKGVEGASSVAVTWSGTVSGSADGDYLVMKDSLGYQMMGIRGIIDDGNPPLLAGGLHGITVASNPDWKSQVFGNGGTNRDLTMALLQSPLTQIGLRSSASEADIDLMLCNGFVKDKYIALLVADQRHPNVTVLKGGQTAVEFNGKQIVVDNQCRRNTMYYINTSELDFLTASGGIKWADHEGSKWVRKIGSSGYAAAYQAFITIEGNLGCRNRAAHAVLNDITD
jgi:hypothetical protein